MAVRVIEFDSVEEAALYEFLLGTQIEVAVEEVGETPTEEVVETPSEEVVEETEPAILPMSEDKPKRRGRPRKETPVDTPTTCQPVNTETPVDEPPVATETPVVNFPTIQETRAALVKASEVVGPGRVKDLVMKLTGGVSIKADAIPEDLRQTAIDEANKMAGEGQLV